MIKGLIWNFFFVVLGVLWLFLVDFFLREGVCILGVIVGVCDVLVGL